MRSYDEHERVIRFIKIMVCTEKLFWYYDFFLVIDIVLIPIAIFDAGPYEHNHLHLSKCCSRQHLFGS
jgi:hypothetical protein